jgi:UDP:flavonoid glycosyltransferase YjiC (YdhE family)
MRILVTSTPGTGHVLPLLPLVTALQRSGDEVLWATGSEAHARLTSAGIGVVAAGMATAERTAAFASRWPEVADLAPRQRRPIAFAGMFGSLAAPIMLTDLEVIVDEFRPEIVVREPSELAIAILAAERDLRCVTVGFGGLIPDSSIVAAAERVAPLWADRGLPMPTDLAMYESLYLHPFPSAFGPVPTGLPIFPMRSVEPPTTGDLPEWIGPLGRDRRCVYVTFGTEVAARAPWPAIVAGLADLDVDVVATTGPMVDPAAIEAMGPNVRAARFVAQGLLLDRCSLVVSHAGAGTVLGSVSRGLPMVSLPIAADQWDNADAIANADCGLTLEADRSADSIGAAARRLLTEESFARAARQVGEDLTAMPPPTSHVERIHALVD